MEFALDGRRSLRAKLAHLQHNANFSEVKTKSSRR